MDVVCQEERDHPCSSHSSHTSFCHEPWPSSQRILQTYRLPRLSFWGEITCGSQYLNPLLSS